MKIITVEEHFMVKEINDRFNQIIKPKDEFDKNQLGLKFIETDPVVRPAKGVYVDMLKCCPLAKPKVYYSLYSRKCYCEEPDTLLMQAD